MQVLSSALVPMRVKPNGQATAFQAVTSEFDSRHPLLWPMLLVTAFGAGSAGASPAAPPIYVGHSVRAARRNIQLRPLPEN